MNERKVNRRTRKQKKKRRGKKQKKERKKLEKHQIIIFQIVLLIGLIASFGGFIASTIRLSNLYLEGQDYIITEEINGIVLQPNEYWFLRQSMNEDFFIHFTISKKTFGGMLSVYLTTLDNVTFFDTFVAVYNYTELTTLYRSSIISRTFEPTFYHEYWIFLIVSEGTNNDTIVFDLSLELSSDFIIDFDRNFSLLKTTRDYILAPILAILSLVFIYEKTLSAIKLFKENISGFKEQKQGENKQEKKENSQEKKINSGKNNKE